MADRIEAEIGRRRKRTSVIFAFAVIGERAADRRHRAELVVRHGDGKDGRGHIGKPRRALRPAPPPDSSSPSAPGEKLHSLATPAGRSSSQPSRLPGKYPNKTVSTGMATCHFSSSRHPVRSRIVPPIGILRAHRQHAVDPAGVPGKPRQKTADAVADDVKRLAGPSVA